jgi:hypothetical protein
VKAIRSVKLSDFVIEEVLLVFESFRAANVLNEKMSECGRYQVAILARQLDSGLRAVIDYENCSTIIAI